MTVAAIHAKALELARDIVRRLEEQREQDVNLCHDADTLASTVGCWVDARETERVDATRHAEYGCQPFYDWEDLCDECLAGARDAETEDRAAHASYEQGVQP